jgi:hypothetical protein
MYCLIGGHLLRHCVDAQNSRENVVALFFLGHDSRFDFNRCARVNSCGPAGN